MGCTRKRGHENFHKSSLGGAIPIFSICQQYYLSHNFLNLYPLAMKFGTNVVFNTSNNVTSLRSPLEGAISKMFIHFFSKTGIVFTKSTIKADKTSMVLSMTYNYVLSQIILIKRFGGQNKRYYI